MNYLTQNVAKTSFVEQLKLAEKARELIEAMHRRAQARKDGRRSVRSQPLFNARTPSFPIVYGCTESTVRLFPDRVVPVTPLILS